MRLRPQHAIDSDQPHVPAQCVGIRNDRLPPAVPMPMSMPCRFSTPTSPRLAVVTVLFSLGVACAGDADAIPDDPTSSGQTGSDPSSTGSNDDDDDDDTTTATGDDSGTGDGDCEIPQYDDEIEVAYDQAVTLPDEIRRIAVAEDLVVTCGHRFVAAVSNGSILGSTIALPDECSGLAVAGGRGVVVTRSGHVRLLGVDATMGLTELDQIDDDGTYFDVGLDGTRAYIAAGAAGVHVYDVDASTLARHDDLPGATEARGVAITGERLLVADGLAGVRLLARDGSGEVATLPGGGRALGVVVRDNKALILRGPRGFDLVQLGDTAIEHLASSPFEGMVVDAWLGDKDVFVATAAALVRYRIDETNQLIDVGRELRPRSAELLLPWFLAVARDDDDATEPGLLALGDRLLPWTASPIADTPDVRPGVWWRPINGEVGEPTPTLVTFLNFGTRDAIITDVSGTPEFDIHVREEDWPPPRPGCPGQYVLEPRDWIEVRAKHTAVDTQPVVGEMHVASNDPEPETVTSYLLAHRVTPSVGAPGPEIAGVTWHGERFRLSDTLGDVVLVKVIAPG